MTLAYITIALWILLSLALVALSILLLARDILRDRAARRLWIKTHPGLSVDQMPGAISGASAEVISKKFL